MIMLIKLFLCGSSSCGGKFIQLTGSTHVVFLKIVSNEVLTAIFQLL